MIENHFKLGVMFTWNKPANNDGQRDGSIIPTRDNSPSLTYVGLGEVVDPTLMVIHVKALGLELNAPINYTWLDYAPGRTAKVALGAKDVLTGPMSGCIIARWNDTGVTSIGHVGTVESSKTVNDLVKSKFAEAVPKQGPTGFNPAEAWDLNECLQLMQKVGISNRPDVFGLVTTTGQFYSLVMVQMPATAGANRWYCLGSKRMDPKPLSQLL